MKNKLKTKLISINNLFKFFIIFFLLAPNYSKANELFNNFYMDLTEVAINMSAVNGITAKCFTLEMTGNINTNNFWKNKLLEHLKKIEEPAYIIGYFEEYIIKYHPNRYDPMDFNTKNGEFTKKYYRMYEGMTKKTECLGGNFSKAYQNIEDKLIQTKISAALMFASFAKLETNKANSYLSYFKTNEPAVFNFLLDGLKLMQNLNIK